MEVGRQRARTFFILGVRVDTMDRSQALDLVDRFLSSRNGAPMHNVYFVNVHSIHLARRDRELQRIINTADVVLPDGSGLKLAGWLLGTPIVENLNGTDFLPLVFERAQARNWSVYLLGSGHHVIYRCKERLLQRYPALRIVGMHPGYFTPEEELRIIQEINRLKPDMVMVALGSPLQEKWIARNAHLLNVRVCFAVGGLFDFLSGVVPRAPTWMRRLGLEWLYRFIQQPRQKWERVFIEIPHFLIRILVRRIIPRRLYDRLTVGRFAR